jgi:phosphoglycolate phosphatase
LDLSHIRGIVFDKDGTLFGFNATWTFWAKTFLTDLAKGNSQIAAHLGQAIGYDYESEAFLPGSVAIAGTPEDIANALLPYVPGRSAQDLIWVMNVASSEAPQAEVVALVPFLSELRSRGFVLGVATNDAEMPARAHLRSVNTEAHFAFIAGSDSGFGGKPSAGQLQAFCQKVGLTPDKILMVGDSSHDIVAGRALGCLTCGVLTGLATQIDLEKIADFVLPDISHLLKVLEHSVGAD